MVVNPQLGILLKTRIYQNGTSTSNSLVLIFHIELAKVGLLRSLTYPCQAIREHFEILSFSTIYTPLGVPPQHSFLVNIRRCSGKAHAKFGEDHPVV